MINFDMDVATSTGTLVLSGALTIAHARDLHAGLVDVVSQVGRLVVNLEQVDSVDLTSLQLLCAAHRRLVQQGKEMVVTGAVPDLVRQAVFDSGYVGCVGGNDDGGLWKGVND